MNIAITRVRNVGDYINLTLDHVSAMGFQIIALDDCSTDDTWEKLCEHPAVIDGIRLSEWESDPAKRLELESSHRNQIYKHALAFDPEWVYYFDADEFITDFDSSLLRREFNSLYFRLFDFYITEEDKDKHFTKREYIGPEYRDITMMFRPQQNTRFFNRIPHGIKGPTAFGGFVKHYGKAISIQEWEDKCEYYAKHTTEKDVKGIPISEKWEARKGKAIHKTSDYGEPLIKWSERSEKGIKNTH